MMLDCLERMLPCTQSISCMYAAGPVLVSGAVSLIGYAAFVDYRYLLPATLPQSGGKRSMEWYIHASVSAFVLGNVIFNYSRCVATNVRPAPINC